MDILKFRVRGQALTLINPNVNLIPVTDTVNQYLCQFEFNEDWDDLNKVVVFKNVSYNITKEVYLSTSNECYIPWEVLSNSGDIFLEVIGTESRGEVVTVRIPSTLLGFKWQIQEGLLDVSANISPTPDLFEQFVSSVRSDSIVAATARDEAVIARDVAVQSAADASASELAATSAAESAENSASTASSAASSASEAALSVAGIADETRSYAEIASTKAAEAATEAELAAGAKEDAVMAKNDAEAARDAAVVAKNDAETARDATLSAKETFDNNAETKLTAYNHNALEKTASYNTNATEKLNAYNANADNRVAEFNAQTEQIQADVSELKSDLTYSQIVTDIDFSDRETGYYVNNKCVKTALEGTFISSPVSVKTGQKVILYIASHKNFCMISKYNNGTYYPLMLGTTTDYNTAYMYEYTVTEDCDIVFSGYDRNDYYAKIILPVADTFDDLGNMNRREAKVEPLEIGYYINSSGSKVPLGTPTRGGVVTAPIYLEKGETLTIYAMSYKIMSAIALIVGNTYKPVVLGNDTYEESYKPYTYKAEFDCFVVVSAYSQLPPYGYIKRQYNVENKPFDNLLVGAGLVSAYSTMGFIGDSISSGECYSNEGGTNTAHDIYEVSWGQYLAKMCGATGYNWSRGGQTSKTWLAEWSNNSSFIDHPCKMYCIGLGQNDGYDLTDSRAVPLGTTADVGTEAETFYGLYSKIIRRVKEIQPKAHIFVITNPIDQIEANGYNDAIRYMATAYDNVFLLDYYTYGQDAINSPLMLSQKRSGHYTALGYRIMAQYINTYIDWYIRNNPEKFTQIEFIGTEWSWT